jgi:hypothetical protein
MFPITQVAFRLKPILLAFLADSVVGHVYYGMLGSVYQECIKLYHKKRIVELQKSFPRAMVWTYIDALVVIAVYNILMRLVNVTSLSEALSLGFLIFVGFHATRLHMYMFQGIPTSMFILNTAHYLISTLVIVAALYVF